MRADNNMCVLIASHSDKTMQVWMESREALDYPMEG